MNSGRQAGRIKRICRLPAFLYKPFFLIFITAPSASFGASGCQPGGGTPVPCSGDIRKFALRRALSGTRYRLYGQHGERHQRFLLGWDTSGLWILSGRI